MALASAQAKATAASVSGRNEEKESFMTCSTGVTTPVRKPIDQDACGVMKEDEGEIRGAVMNASKW